MITRRRLYSNIIAEDNGDIGITSTVYVWDNYDYYWFENIVTAFLSENIVGIVLDEQKYDDSRYDRVEYEYNLDNRIDIKLAKLSDNMAKRFNYDVSKLNTFISGYTDTGFNGDMLGIRDIKLVDVYFNDYGSTIYLMGKFSFTPEFFRMLTLSVPSTSSINRIAFTRNGVDFNITADGNISKYINDTYTPCIYSGAEGCIITFKNLFIQEDDLVDLIYTEKTYAYEEGTINDTFMCRTSYDDQFNTTFFSNTSFSLSKPNNIGTDNYTYIITSCNITSTIDVSIIYGKDFFEIIPEQSSQSGEGFVRVSNINYKIIYETNIN